MRSLWWLAWIGLLQRWDTGVEWSNNLGNPGLIWVQSLMLLWRKIWLQLLFFHRKFSDFVTASVNVVYNQRTVIVCSCYFFVNSVSIFRDKPSVGPAADFFNDDMMTDDAEISTKHHEENIGELGLILLQNNVCPFCILIAAMMWCLDHLSFTSQMWPVTQNISSVSKGCNVVPAKGHWCFISWKEISK